jgi:hypothetical protein
MPTITRQRSRPGLRMVEAGNFPACILVARPHDGDHVLVVVSDEVPAAKLRSISRVLLRQEERRHLSRFLSDRRRKR